MRRMISALAIGLAILIANSSALSARDVATGTDQSAAKKKKQATHQTKKQHVYVYRSPYAQPSRRPWADPSFDENGRPYRSPYAPNQCSIDLGYGRFESCDNVY